MNNLPIELLKVEIIPLLQDLDLIRISQVNKLFYSLYKKEKKLRINYFIICKSKNKFRYEFKRLYNFIKDHYLWYPIILDNYFNYDNDYDFMIGIIKYSNNKKLIKIIYHKFVNNHYDTFIFYIFSNSHADQVLFDLLPLIEKESHSHYNIRLWKLCKYKQKNCLNYILNNKFVIDPIKIKDAIDEAKYNNDLELLKLFSKN